MRGRRREDLDGEAGRAVEAGVGDRGPWCDQKIGLDHRVRAEDDGERRHHDPQVGGAPGVEGDQEPDDRRLVSPLGRRCHDERTVDQLMAPPVVGERLQVGAGHGATTRERRHVVHGASSGLVGVRSAGRAVLVRGQPERRHGRARP